ncbi:MAG: hypothetical protein KAU50_05445 [Candidatus Marinimicrobia bacterium]|nr:hypothetical protein [Candidatus Neomarinimicrobiota bacterium]
MTPAGRDLIQRLILGAYLAAGLSALTPLYAEDTTRVVAIVGTEQITLGQFVTSYSVYLAVTEAEDSLETRLGHLQGMLGDLTISAHGRALGLFDSLHFQQIGWEAWRDYLLEQVAAGHFQDEITITQEAVEQEYRYRNTILHSRYLLASDSLLAASLARRLARGELFESLALQTMPAKSPLDLPGYTGWKYPAELDDAYARVAYELDDGAISTPLKAAGGYQAIQLLEKDFRPDHGHFERVKRYQLIAAELPRGGLQGADVALEVLDNWVADLPLKWRLFGPRKVLRSGVLNQDGSGTAVIQPDDELLSTALFEIDDEPFTLDWLLSRWELLSPDNRNNLTSTSQLKDKATILLKWDRMMDLAAALPQAEGLMVMAEEARDKAIQLAIRDSLSANHLRHQTPTEDQLISYTRTHAERYWQPPLIRVHEIIVADSLQAFRIKDSLANGVDWGLLAQLYTERIWARERGADLGWVSADIYQPHVDTLINAERGATIGPLPLPGYWILLHVNDKRAAGLPRMSGIRPRVLHDWYRDHSDSLITEWVGDLQTRLYPVIIDTGLLIPNAPDTSAIDILPEKTESNAVVPDTLESVIPAAEQLPATPPEPQ